MSHDVFCGFALPVALAFLALVLILALLAPALARELATLRRPPPVRMPAGADDTMSGIGPRGTPPARDARLSTP